MSQQRRQLAKKLHLDAIPNSARAPTASEASKKSRNFAPDVALVVQVRNDGGARAPSSPHGQENRSRAPDSSDAATVKSVHAFVADAGKDGVTMSDVCSHVGNNHATAVTAVKTLCDKGTLLCVHGYDEDRLVCQKHSHVWRADTFNRGSDGTIMNKSGSRLVCLWSGHDAAHVVMSVFERCQRAVLTVVLLRGPVTEVRTCYAAARAAACSQRFSLCYWRMPARLTCRPVWLSSCLPSHRARCACLWTSL